jgi:TRAP-type mannitol/chloroaromatic compound transport system permease small subunit
MRIIKYIDAISHWTGTIAAWMVVPLTTVVVYEVILRYILNSPTKWAYDASWILYSVLFMLGGAYTLLNKRHIRIDLVYRLLPARGRAIFDIMCFGIILVPIMILLTREGVRYASMAWAVGERLSTSMWLFPSGPVKTIIPVGFFLLGLQGVAELVRTAFAAARGEEL